MATSSRGGPPGTSRTLAAAPASSEPRCPSPPETPVGARYSPNTSRSAPAHSPVVPPACARAMVAGMRFSPDSAARLSSPNAACTPACGRAERHAATSSRRCASMPGSTVRIDDAGSAARWRGESSVSVKELTPITFCSPDSILRSRSAWLATSRDLSSSIASNAPPSDTTSSSSFDACSTIEVVFSSMTCEPFKMSSYSSRSVS